MEQIINQLIANFDFGLMFILNVVTYVVIKLTDEINKDKIVTTWQKRIIFVCASLIIGCVYYFLSDVKPIVIIDSTIVAPIAWSWLAKPIAIKLGIDYRKNNK